MDDNLQGGIATDVWSCGMAGIEVSHQLRNDVSLVTRGRQIFSDRFPFYKSKPLAVMYKVTNGELPVRKDYPEINDDAWDVLALCWNFDPAQRPSMTDLSARLDIIAHRRSDIYFPDTVCTKGHQTNGRGNTSTFFSKSHAILSSLRISGRDRAISFPEASVYAPRLRTAPFPYQWKDSDVQGSALKEFKTFQLHDTERSDRIHVINLPR
jgi:serine/threonine protein kinase